MENNDLLKDTVKHAIFGVPELKPDEKRRYLGQFKENVIAVVKAEDAADIEIPHFIRRLSKENNADYVIISSDLGPTVYGKILEATKDTNTQIRYYQNDEARGDIKIVVTSREGNYNDQPLEFKKTMPQKFRQAHSNYLCSICYKELQETAPHMVDNFRLIGFVEKMAGIKCGTCQEVDNGPLI
jgi:uncharacterized protein YueI